jgi:hypothetical protein
MKAGILVALFLAAVLMIVGCTQEEESSAPEEETTEEATTEPTAEERTIIKETTVVMVPAPGPPPAPAPRPDSEGQAAADPELDAAEVDIPHDGTVVPCYLDPVCSSEQARIQNEFVAEMKQPKTYPPYTEPARTPVHDMCTNAVRSGVRPLPAVCRGLGG